MYTEETVEKQTNGLWFRVILETPNIYSFKYAKRLAEEKEALKDIIWAVITESLREVLCSEEFKASCCPFPFSQIEGATSIFPAKGSLPFP